MNTCQAVNTRKDLFKQGDHSVAIDIGECGAECGQVRLVKEHDGPGMDPLHQIHLPLGFAQ